MWSLAHSLEKKKTTIGNSVSYHSNKYKKIWHNIMLFVDFTTQA